MSNRIDPNDTTPAGFARWLREHEHELEPDRIHPERLERFGWQEGDTILANPLPWPAGTTPPEEQDPEPQAADALIPDADG